jgi:CBS domain containing-hemolysin-like protein
MNVFVGILLVLLLISANGFFVAVEFALVASDRSKLEARAAEGKWAARAALATFSRLSFHLSGAQLGITITSLVLGFLIEPLVGELLEPLVEPVVGTGSGWTIALSIAIATVAQTVLGELIPKNLAIARPEGVAQALAPAAQVVHTILSPFIVTFNGAANWTVRRLGIEPREELNAVRSLEEIEYLIRSSGETGTIAPDAVELLNRSLRFNDKDVADALTPRVHVTGLHVDGDVGDLVGLTRSSGHSRYPVFGDDLDDVRGVVDIGSVFSLPEEGRDSVPIRQIMREPTVVPETRELHDILDDFSRVETDLLIVLDEHGGMAGVLTLEDVLEELAGDVDDEYDAATRTTTARRGVSVVAGTLHADEVVDATGFEMPDGDYETIAGFVLDALGRIPDEGDGLEHDGWLLEVVAMDRLRVASVQLIAPAEPTAVDRTAEPEPAR